MARIGGILGRRSALPVSSCIRPMTMRFGACRNHERNPTLIHDTSHVQSVLRHGESRQQTLEEVAFTHLGALGFLSKQGDPERI